MRREPGAGQVCGLREMGELLDRCTEQQPLLLVTEDLHWSDPATVQLIDYIARRRSPTRLLWLASFRLTEVIATDHPLRAVRRELGLHGLTKEIVLDAFSENEVAEYLATRAPALAADEDFVRALHRRTDGLPLLVADLVSDLVEQGDFALAGGSSAHNRLAAIGIPETLSGIVEQYFARLTPEQQAALEVASACDPEFRLSTVARMLGRDVAALAASWSELARGKRWLRDAPSSQRGDEALYSFRHAVYREVLRKRLGRFAFAELQGRVAASLVDDRRAAGSRGGAVCRRCARSAPRCLTCAANVPKDDEMNVFTALRTAALACLAATLLGCAASTEFNGVWVNSEAGNRVPVKSVLVVAINRDPTARRVYEDTMVAQFASRGIKAQASYRTLPDEALPSPPMIEAAVRGAGADCLLVSRVLREFTDVRITPGHSYGPAGFAGMWSGAYSVPPNVHTAQKVIIDTRLFSAKDLVVLWSGTSTTEPTSSMEKTIAEFGTILTKALGDAKVL